MSRRLPINACARLRRDQIWFTEKDKCGGTALYPLTHFKPRKHENLERGYLQGRYGAIPFLRIADSWPEAGYDWGDGGQEE